jgi:hypothetical protein
MAAVRDDALKAEGGMWKAGFGKLGDKQSAGHGALRHFIGK